MKRRSTAAACLMAAAVILVGIAAFNAGWLTEKTYVRAEWNADTLLIVRTGSEAGVLIDDRVAIDALQNSLTWLLRRAGFLGVCVSGRRADRRSARL